MPSNVTSAAPAMPTAAPAPMTAGGYGHHPPALTAEPPLVVAHPPDDLKAKKKKVPTERKTMCWLKRADLPGDPNPQYPAIWVMMKCMEHGIHEIAPYDSQKTAKWNDVITAFHETWGVIYPAAATAAKAAIEAQVTKVLEGYRAIAQANPDGKHIGAGNIKNYALTENELENVRIYLRADVAARYERDASNDGKPKKERKRQVSEEENARIIQHLDAPGGVGKRIRTIGIGDPGPAAAGLAPTPMAVTAGNMPMPGIVPMGMVMHQHAESFAQQISDLQMRVKQLEDRAADSVSANADAAAAAAAAVAAVAAPIDLGLPK